jgi:hypothetical protein
MFFAISGGAFLKTKGFLTLGKPYPFNPIGERLIFISLIIGRGKGTG